MISSFLSGCSQRVVCNGFISAPVYVTSGVLQGTILEPLLFLAYINDLPGIISSCCSLFADDCLLYRQINNKDDQEILQNYLHNLEQWANKWLMTSGWWPSMSSTTDITKKYVSFLLYIVWSFSSKNKWSQIFEDCHWF